MRLTAIIGGEIHVQRFNSSSSPVLRKAIEENTFKNKAFIDAIKTGRSVRGIPETVQTWRKDESGIVFPRGYGARLHTLAASSAEPIDWMDHRITASCGGYPGRLIGVEPRPYQEQAVTDALKKSQGVVRAPTGSGKTLMGNELLRRLGQRAVILLAARELARQWVEVIRKQLGIECGTIGDGVWTEGEQITVATMQTLASRPDETARFATGIGAVLVDECHHAPALTFARVVGMFPAKYRYGLTATTMRGDGLEEVIYRVIGDVVASVQPDEVQGLGGIVPAIVATMDTGCRFDGVDPADKKGAWMGLVAKLVADGGRNRQIAALAVRVSEKRQTLILTDRVEHAEAIGALIPDALLIHGKLPAKERRNRMSTLADSRVVIGTRGLLGEGLDCSVWSALILAAPMSGEAPLLQAVGRVIRPAPGKLNGLVIDLVDSHPFTLAMLKKRTTVYKKRGWPVTRHGGLGKLGYQPNANQDR
ncbi:MAG: DEAD/DEAH box helicase [Magnetococcales bacterium]|nr:DEAD/DEAH box helicase [Magnetococcales bacterium]